MPASLRHASIRIFEKAVQQVQAEAVLAQADLWDQLPNGRAVRLLTIGKAALPLAAVAGRRLGQRLHGGCAVVPDGYPETVPARYDPPPTIRVLVGGHPLPTRQSMAAADALRTQATAAARAGHVLLVLISGGGTALTAAPAGDLSIRDLQDAFRCMMDAGMPIGPTNVVRKHLTRLGGGHLAQAAHPAPVVAGALSDVVGNDLSTIASGPTVPDPSTYADACAALRAHDAWNPFPHAARVHLQRGCNGQRPETPGPGAPCFQNASTRLLATNDTALAAAAQAARLAGFPPTIVDAACTGEARSVGRAHAERLLRTAGPACLLWGGETTVTVTGTGTGGRNQEVALGAAQRLDGADQPVCLLAAGTDGIDGPTDAAGGVATPATCAAARTKNRSVADALARNDAYPLLDAIDALLRTGPTHTNVMDLHIGLVGT
ncbi:glycerate kinase type-2 family protein [Salisaeta longa]|uniref:glycerate kinase type-2 family protein n=1 Tax=Salisaeta longa TaxID=503170 RepID=UPI0003B3C98E|nr:DUF4147 domain-containing protein [Salisaeta longa]